MNLILQSYRACLTALLACSLFACSASGSRDDDSLYRALGETPGIQRLTTTLFDRVYADTRIAFLFEKTDRADLERLVVEQICDEAGGPCTYTGRTMVESHSGFSINHTDFEAFVEDFIVAMEDLDIPYRTQNRVLKIFAPMRAEIVDK